MGTGSGLIYWDFRFLRRFGVLEANSAGFRECVRA